MKTSLECAANPNFEKCQFSDNDAKNLIGESEIVSASNVAIASNVHVWVVSTRSWVSSTRILFECLKLGQVKREREGN